MPLRGPSHIPLPAGDHPWVHQTAQRFIAEIAAAGYHVIGDLTDLLPTPPAKQPATVPSDADVLAAAIRALAEFLQRTPEASHPRDTARRLQRALRELSNEYPHVMALRRIYWRTKARLSRARPGTTRRRA